MLQQAYLAPITSRTAEMVSGEMKAPWHKPRGHVSTAHRIDVKAALVDLGANGTVELMMPMVVPSCGADA